MWSIIPAQKTPHDLDISRADAKARARFDAQHGDERRRRARPQRRRDELEDDLEVDTFESTTDQESERG